jgi:HEAT repeat protein
MPHYDWPPKPLPSLDAALRDVGSARGSFRRNAAISLGRAPSARSGEAARALAGLLDDPERTVRIEAVYSAASLGTLSLAGAVRRLLASDDPDMRLAALEYVSTVEDGESLEEVEAIGERDPDETVRCMALETLAGLRPERALRQCRRLLAAPDAPVPALRTALVLLRVVGGPGDAEAAFDLLRHERPGVSLEAAATLSHLGDPRGEKRLLDELRRPARVDDRLVALEALCRLTGEGVRALARKRARSMFTGRDERTYWRGILAAHGDSAASARLDDQLRDPDARRAALAMRVAGLCSLEHLVRRLREIAEREDDESLCAESVEALGLMRSPAAGRALEEIAARVRDPARAEHARAALEEVQRWTGS